MLSMPQRKFISVIFTASLFIALIPLQSTAINAAGPAITTTSATALPTILNGKTPPATSLGKNGDFYIDTKNLMFYGPKKNGSWPLGLSMKGEAGKDGVDGKNGIDGAIGKTGATGGVAGVAVDECSIASSAIQASVTAFDSAAVMVPFVTRSASTDAIGPPLPRMPPKPPTPLFI